MTYADGFVFQWEIAVLTTVLMIAIAILITKVLER